MSPGSLPLTAALSAEAKALGVEHDLTRFSLREQAFSELCAAMFKDDGSFEAAKARFDALKPETVE